MYKCTECGNKSTVELGKCNQCQTWGSFKKEKKEVYKTRTMEMFERIWANRPHVSQLTGKPLLPKGHKNWHWQFLHVLSKQIYTYYKFVDENILLALPEEHERQNEYEIFNETHEKLVKQYYDKYGTPRAIKKQQNKVLRNTKHLKNPYKGKFCR